MFVFAWSTLIDQISIFQWIGFELARLERRMEIAHIKGWHAEYPFPH
jgi:hypothetical protein